MMSQFGCHRVAPLLIRAEFPGDLRPGFCLRGAIESRSSTQGLKVTSNLECAGRFSRRCSYAAVPIFFVPPFASVCLCSVFSWLYTPRLASAFGGSTLRNVDFPMLRTCEGQVSKVSRVPGFQGLQGSRVSKYAQNMRGGQHIKSFYDGGAV